MWYLLYKLVRPILPISGGIATWIIARFCDAEPQQAIAAAIAFALGTIGSSLYHYATANWMYTRKSERFKFKNPKALRFIGIIFFCLSLGIAAIWLPKLCALIYIFDALAIIAYSLKLSAHWSTKNILMSIVCTTPIIIGWLAGTQTHPIVFWGMGLTSFAYLAREIVKDVKDIIANNGKRVTLPMVLGPERALQLSGALLIIATFLLFGFLQFTKTTMQISFASMSALVLLITGAMLIFSKKAGRCETQIQFAVVLMLFALI